ncbi:hypothetical protein RhoFasB10_03712 [Rhodococcus sp. B10]|nr:hypothetical protein [Rhodococcus sp. B10]
MIPAGWPETSNASEMVSCRSKFAMSSTRSMASTSRFGSVMLGRAVCWNSSITWNSGVYAGVRTGSRRSTTRSNGTSACVNASRSVLRTASSRSWNEVDDSIRVRNTSVLTNIPTTSSSAASPRPEIGVPTEMSSDPDSADNRMPSAACTIMNTLESRDDASDAIRPCSSASRSNPSFAPRNDGSLGRGRSSGSSSTSGAPDNVSTQNAN